MIYATDLDRTLIYSKRFLECHPPKGEMILVDKSKVDSYISKAVLIRLMEMSKAVRVIPVTTRSVEEYERIKIPGFTPEFAITTCGGVILHKGKKMKYWERYMESEIDKAGIERVVEEFKAFGEYKPKVIDGRYIFTKVEDRESAKIKIGELRKRVAGYKFLLDKHKVYGIPDVVSKVNALKFIKEFLGEPYVLATGDGELDIPMLEWADVAVIPEHKYWESKTKVIKGSITVGGLEESAIEAMNIAEKLNNK